MNMTRDELIKKLQAVTIMGRGRVVVKEIDYSNNPLAPSPKAWSVCYSDVQGCRRRAVYHGEKFGFQWSR